MKELFIISKKLDQMNMVSLIQNTCIYFKAIFNFQRLFSHVFILTSLTKHASNCFYAIWRLLSVFRHFSSVIISFVVSAIDAGDSSVFFFISKLFPVDEEFKVGCWRFELGSFYIHNVSEKLAVVRRT